MIDFKEITLENISEIAVMYVETFNAEPWNDKWTIDTASKRLHQMINVEDFYGICAYQNDVICGMILGSMEQFYDHVIYNAKEFCVKNGVRGQGLGTIIFKEVENRLKNMGVGQIFLYTSEGEYTEHFYHKQNLESYSNLVAMGKRL